MKTLAIYDISESVSEEQLINALLQQYSLRPEAERGEKQVYCDTFDWRLYEQGLVAVRDSRELTLRTLESDRVVTRTPLTGKVRFAAEIPPGTLRERLAPLIEMRALLPQAALELHSKPYRVLNRNQKTVVWLTLETAHLPGDSGINIPLKRLALHSVRGYEEDLQTLSALLEREGIRPATESLYLKALKAMKIIPGSYSGKLNVPLDPQMSAEAAAKEILKFLLTVIQANQEGIKQDIDTEFLHDFRVAIRRTRSALSQIKGVFPPEITARFRRDFARVGSSTNWLRDLDVYLLNAGEYRSMLPAPLRDAIVPLFDYLQRQRKKELRKVIKMLVSDSYARILSDWEKFLYQPSQTLAGAPNAAVPIIDLARRRIYKRYRLILKAGRQITGEKSPDEALHQLRIDCKKLRYLLEFFAPLFPATEVKKLIKQLKKLQDNLGRFQDISVQEESLQQFVGHFSTDTEQDRRTIMAIGSLIGTLEGEKKRVRAAFADTFSKFAKKGNRKLYRQLFA